MQYGNDGIERSVVSGEIVREEVEGGWPEDDVWFEFDIKECLDSQSGMNISFQVP